MNTKTTVAGLMLAASFGVQPAGAVTVDDFVIDDAKDLAVLCAIPASDPAHVAALQFCYGYMQGAYDYYLAERRGPDADFFVCLPKPEPSRDEVARLFSAWIDGHPERNKDEAVEALFQFGAEKWPCPKKQEQKRSDSKS
ncbi:MAG: Rap1a/Tai family immunity protein [Methylococcus sp.]|nr:Rap1a/Tai family immunity protein [Methylococcus sp.]